MKKLITLALITTFASTSVMTVENNCESILTKIKPSCNLISRGVDKMIDFSSKNKTIDQSVGNIKKILPKKQK